MRRIQVFTQVTASGETRWRLLGPRGVGYVWNFPPTSTFVVTMVDAWAVDEGFDSGPPSYPNAETALAACANHLSQELP